MRALFQVGTSTGLTDEQLLHRFNTCGDEESARLAFATIVARHGAMVWRACRAITRDDHLADDAFQAAFLVLARRAGRLWTRDSLGPWLHTVAVRVSADAKRSAQARSRRERIWGESFSTAESHPASPDDDLVALIHEEIRGLPWRYRAPVVFCDLEGLTHAEAAGRLGCPVGTLKTRLTAARERLRARLLRRGLTPGLLPPMFGSAGVSAASSEHAVQVAIATRGFAGAAAASTAVAYLAKGVTFPMILSPIKLALVALGLPIAGLIAASGLENVDGNGPPPVSPAPAAVQENPSAESRPLSITVVDRRNDRPLSGVRLTFQFNENESVTTTDELGRGVFSVPKGDATFARIRARREGFVPIAVQWGHAAAIPAEYRLPMDPGTTIGGTVVDEEGRPIAGATVFALLPIEVPLVAGVRMYADLWDEPNRTDDAGRWSCKIVPSDLRDVWLRLSHPDFVSDHHYGLTPKPSLTQLRDGSARQVMKKGESVSGIVRDDRGRPVAGANVLLGGDRSGGHYPSVVTDDQGRFRFDQVASGGLVLTVQAKGRAPEMKEWKSAVGVSPVEFVLGPGRTLRGRVLDESGMPIPGARITCDAWREHSSLEIKAVADAEGRFSIEDLPPDAVELQFSKPGYRHLPNQRCQASEKELIVRLGKPLVISGKVLDATTGRPIDNVMVFEIVGRNDPERPMSRGPGKGFRNGRYEFTFAWPYPEIRSLRFEAEGYRAVTSRAFRNDEGTQTLDVRLSPGHDETRPEITGVLRLPDGAPAEGVEVYLAHPDSTVFLADGRLSEPIASLVGPSKTDAAGRFRFAGQPGPMHVVVADDRGFVEAAEDELVKPEGPSLTLRPWGRLEGTVRVGSRPGWQEEIVFESRARESDRPRSVRFQEATRADASGRFLFRRVPPRKGVVGHSVAIAPTRRAYGPWVKVEVPPGGTTQVEIGGKGMPIIGRAVAPEKLNVPVDWIGGGSIQFRQKPPPVPEPDPGAKMTREERAAWFANWFATEAGKAYRAYLDEPRFYPVVIDRHGRFRIDDVAPGTYELTVRLLDSPPNQRKSLAGRTTVVEVPKVPGGRTDEPLDLGSLTLDPNP